MWREINVMQYHKFIKRTIENPAKISLTKVEILIGCSKSPKVTAFTANRDCGGIARFRQNFKVPSDELIR